MKQTVVLVAMAAMALSAAARAQQPAAQQPPAPLPGIVAEVKNAYTTIQSNIVKAAEQFPEDKLTWQPTPAVRSWARLIGHITDDNNVSCWLLAGEAQAPPRVDPTDSQDSPANKLSKSDLVKGLKASVERCTKAFANVNEANMGERNGPNGRRSKFFTLIYNTSHTNEHYGNIATYMRLNNLVPPSSQPRVQ
ncbi:MAG TPA: DinB family protein [Vicinamibacterales bacterium]|nr:DinB family protein [Vicinamibacterales bacterium]